MRSNQHHTTTPPSRHHHGTITVPSLYHHCAIRFSVLAIWQDSAQESVNVLCVHTRSFEASTSLPCGTSLCLMCVTMSRHSSIVLGARRGVVKMESSIASFVLASRLGVIKACMPSRLDHNSTLQALKSPDRAAAQCLASCTGLRRIVAVNRHGHRRHSGQQAHAHVKYTAKKWGAAPRVGTFVDLAPFGP